MFIVIQIFLEHIEMMVPDETRTLYTWQDASITVVATPERISPQLLPA